MTASPVSVTTLVKRQLIMGEKDRKIFLYPSDISTMHHVFIVKNGFQKGEFDGEQHPLHPGDE